MRERKPLGRLAAVLAAAVLGAAPALAQRIVVVDDEWPLSDPGIVANPEGSQFALNVVDWFTCGQPGSFLVHSHNFGLAGGRLAQTMTDAGHAWTVQTVGAPIDLGILSGYDAVFLGGVPVDPAMLVQYVQAGGGVYVMAGTAWAPSSAAEAAYWNPFLATFGLSFATVYNGFGNFPLPVAGPHPVLTGVTGLYHSNGQSLLDLAPADDAQVLATYMGEGLVAVYEEPAAQVYCTAKPGSLGCSPQIAFAGRPAASCTLPFDVMATDIRSQKSGFLFYGTNGRLALPFLGGTLCVAPPLRRSTTLFSGGNGPPDDCSGTLSIDVNALIGVDPVLVVGATVQAQFFYRDTGASFLTGLTDAVEFTIAP